MTLATYLDIFDVRKPPDVYGITASIMSYFEIERCRHFYQL